MKNPLFIVVALVCSAAVSSSVHALDIINLFPGDRIEDDTVIDDGTTVNVLGGTIGLGVDLSNGILNVESGSVALGANSIATGFTNINNQVSVSGGNLGGFFQLTNGTNLNVTGGQLESFGVFSNSTATISSGVVTRFPDIFSSGEVTISGGDVFAVRVFAGGRLNLIGTEFFIDGERLDLTFGEEFIIDQRNVTLTGTLTDGSFFENDLNTTFGNFFGDNPDGAAFGATITVTAIPEPSLATVLALGGILTTVRRRRS